MHQAAQVLWQLAARRGRPVAARVVVDAHHLLKPAVVCAQPAAAGGAEEDLQGVTTYAQAGAHASSRERLVWPAMHNAPAPSVPAAMQLRGRQPGDAVLPARPRMPACCSASRNQELT